MVPNALDMIRRKQDKLKISWILKTTRLFAKNEAAKEERLQKCQGFEQKKMQRRKKGCKNDSLGGNYGDLQLEVVQWKDISGRKWIVV